MSTLSNNIIALNYARTKWYFFDEHEYCKISLIHREKYVPVGIVKYINTERAQFESERYWRSEIFMIHIRAGWVLLQSAWWSRAIYFIRSYKLRFIRTHSRSLIKTEARPAVILTWNTKHITLYIVYIYMCVL